MPKSPVNIDLGAKVNVEVKTEVPAEVSGRFVDIINKLLSPWAEGRALRADLIRLHREEVAVEIAKRAARRIEFENPNPRPIPLKVLLPLLEKGSQETATDQFMIDIWASLLASANKEGSISPRFVNLIAELDSRQAKILSDCANSLPYVHGASNVIGGQLIQWAESNKFNFRKLSQKLSRMIVQSGGILIEFAFSEARTGNKTRHARPSGYETTDLAVLESLGLIKLHEIMTQVDNGKWSFFVEYFAVTNLGRALMKMVIPRSRT